MPVIEISGPDEQGQYTVEVESDDQEQAEAAGAGGNADSAGAGGDDSAAGSGSGDSGSSAAPVTCASVKDVLVAVKQILTSGQASAPSQSSQDMWNQEAASRAAQRQQSNSY